MNIQVKNNIELIKKELLNKQLTVKQLSQKTKIPISSIYRVLKACEFGRILNVSFTRKLNKNKIPTKLYSLNNK